LASETAYRNLLQGAGKNSILAQLRKKAEAINEQHRSLIKEIAAETQYLGSFYPEAVISRAIHYQHDYLVLCQLENLVLSGKIREARELIAHPEKGVQGMQYALEMTPDLFRNHFIIGFFRGGDNGNTLASWTRERVLYYHDLWSAAIELASGEPSGGSWQPLLESLSAARARAEENLRQALADDVALWRRARLTLHSFTPVPSD